MSEKVKLDSYVSAASSFPKEEDDMETIPSAPFNQEQSGAQLLVVGRKGFKQTTKQPLTVPRQFPRWEDFTTER